MNNTLETFAANLNYAIRNRETVTIGNGQFSSEELKPILTVINAAIASERLEALRDKIYDEHATGLDS